jgi:competence protein ComEA
MGIYLSAQQTAYSIVSGFLLRCEMLFLPSTFNRVSTSATRNLSLCRRASGAGFAPLLIGLLFAGGAQADLLPDGPGKAATVRVCGKCHSPERAVSLHQGHSQWEETITKMVKLGAQGSDDEFEAVLGYLSKNFGTEVPAPINLNKANLVDLQTVLALRRSQAKAILLYRSQNGDFKSLADLRNVPGLDFQKLEAKKARIIF